MHVHHPSNLLEPGWVSLIRDAAPAAEKAGRLEPCQLDLIYSQGWFKLLITKALGGLQMDLPGLLRLEEALSWADGSLGWVVTLCCGAGWFGGFIEQTFAANEFAADRVCLAGSGAPGGVAELTDEGYIINGRWNYASGAAHATHLTANCIVQQNGIPLSQPDGEPLILPFIFRSNEVTVLPAWKYMGMMATGSDAFEVKTLFVDPVRQFKIDPRQNNTGAQVYDYPFLQLAETTLSVNLAGMSIHFMDLCETIFSGKIQHKKLTVLQENLLWKTLESAKVNVELIRHKFYTAVDSSWNNKENAAALQHVSVLSRQLARTALNAVDALYPYCGLEAAGTTSAINRVWRDIHTASQHALLTFPDE
jgi:alkylation response protein AidB-like acyl-CoA dehydrogenase